MPTVNDLLQAANRYLRYHRKAITRYQAHSPFLFGFFEEVLDDRRHYYAFDDIERLRHLAVRSMGYADVTDYGTGSSRRITLRELATKSASRPQKGRRLFRLVQWMQPARILELGTSIGIGTAYLASGNTRAQVLSLEGAAALADIARAHLKLLGLQNTAVITGRFEDLLPQILPEKGPFDLIYIDGNHRMEPTLQYFESCLPHLCRDGLIVFDDIHWSEDMEAAWEAVCSDRRVRLALDCFDVGVVSCSDRFKEKQSFSVIPFRHKPWYVF